MERWPYGEAPVGYINYLMDLQRKYGQRISNVKIKPPGGIYIGKGSPWANPYRGSNSITERVNNIYNFDMYYRKEFFKVDGPISFIEVWKSFGNNPLRQVVCYCNDGTNIPKAEHLCHGLIIMASLGKALDETQQYELDLVFDKE